MSATGLRLRIQGSDGNVTEILRDGSLPEYVIGRVMKTARPDPGMIFIEDKFASRRHFRLYWDDEDGQWLVEDLGSSNGTRINDSFIVRPEPLTDGATARVGTTDIVFSFLTPEESARLPKEAAPPLPVLPDHVGAEETIAAHTMLMGKAVKTGDPTFMGSSAPSAPPARGAAKGGDPTLMPPQPTLTQAKPADRTMVRGRAQGGDPTFVGQGDSAAPGHAYSGFDMEAAAIAAAKIAALADSDVGGTMSEATAMDLGGGLRDVGELASPLVASLLRANLLPKKLAIQLFDRVRTTGQTFFRILGEDDRVQFKDEIYRHVSREFHLPLIEEERALSDQAEETPWLTFGQAANLGLVCLQAESPDEVRVAAMDPFDLSLEDWIQRCAAGRTLTRFLVPSRIFNAVLARLKQRPDEEGDDIGMAINITTHQERVLRERLDNVEVPQMVNYFLYRAHTQGASDIHIEPTEDFLVVRNRVDGVMREDTTLPLELHPEVSSRLKIMSNMDVAEKRRPQDGRISVTIQDNPIDIRVSSFPTVYGEKLVLRLLDKGALRPSIDSLGLLARDLRLLKDKLNAPFGLIMISGPTGSGKTTTLYSCLSSIDKNSKNVLTVEDPVEYRLKGVHQMQVNDKIGLNFASGLRTILRQDPDVIMVGECRDTETASMAIQASLTGHIVFSTIHANDSVGVVTRLLDMEIEPFLVGTSLSIAIAQRLVRRICTHCKTSLPGSRILEQLVREGASAHRLKNLGIEIDPELSYAQGAGCQLCHNTGYLKRQAVFEVFEMTEEARAIILAPDFNAEKLRQYVRRTGMTSLVGHGLKLVEEEETTFSEVIRVLGE